MPSAKQIAWRKKFAKMSKAGKFRKKTMHEDRMIKGRPKSNGKKLALKKKKLL